MNPPRPIRIWRLRYINDCPIRQLGILLRVRPIMRLAERKSGVEDRVPKSGSAERRQSVRMRPCYTSWINRDWHVAVAIVGLLAEGPSSLLEINPGLIDHACHDLVGVGIAPEDQRATSVRFAEFRIGLHRRLPAHESAPAVTEMGHFKFDPRLKARIF